MNDKTVITQNTPHKVTVPEGTSNASRPIINRGQGGEPTVLETPANRHAVPAIEEAARALHEFDKVASADPIGAVDFGTQNPQSATHQSPPSANDPDRALLEDWSLSPELIARIDDLRIHNTRVQNQIDQLTAPSRKARA